MQKPRIVITILDSKRTVGYISSSLILRCTTKNKNKNQKQVNLKFNLIKQLNKKILSETVFDFYYFETDLIA